MAQAVSLAESGYEQDEDCYHAQIPALPGCYSWGYTYEEALKNIKEAAELWLETMAEDLRRLRLIS